MSQPTEWRFTAYFETTRRRPDRADIPLEWIVLTAAEPEHREVQADGRLRCWRRIPDADGRWLRVIVLNDGATIHNAFLDRRFGR